MWPAHSFRLPGIWLNGASVYSSRPAFPFSPQSLHSGGQRCRLFSNLAAMARLLQ